MERLYCSYIIFLLIITLHIQNPFISGAVLSAKEKNPTPSSDTIYVAVSSANSNPNHNGNLTPNKTGSVGSGPSFNTGADQILGAVSSYRPQVSSSSSYSSFSSPINDIQQSLPVNSPAVSAHQDFLEEQPISLTGGWTAPTESDSVISAPTLLMETTLNIGISAAVSSTHAESLHLEGDHENPAIANVLFGSDAHYGVFGTTLQESSGSGLANQFSEGNIDGGSSKMYDIMLMGAHNEVTVNGTSDAVGTGSMTQQSLSDIIHNENQHPQIAYQSPAEVVENIEEPAEVEQHFQAAYETPAETVANVEEQAEMEQLLQGTYQTVQETSVETVEGLAEQMETEQHILQTYQTVQETSAETVEGPAEQMETEQHNILQTYQTPAEPIENFNEQAETEQPSQEIFQVPVLPEESHDHENEEIITNLAEILAEELLLHSEPAFPNDSDIHTDEDQEEQDQEKLSFLFNHHKHKTV